MPLCKNLASGKLNSNISASTTSISVYVGNGSSSTVAGVWPNTPFYATIMPSNPTAGVPNSLDSEIIKVTAVTGGASGNVTMTIVRGQKGVTAKAFTAGSIVSHAIYAEEAVFVDDPTTQEPETPWVTSDMIDWDDMESSSGTQGIKRADFGKLHILINTVHSNSGSGVISFELPDDWKNNATKYNSTVQARHWNDNNADGTIGACWISSSGYASFYQIQSYSHNDVTVLCVGFW